MHIITDRGDKLSCPFLKLSAGCSFQCSTTCRKRFVFVWTDENGDFGKPCWAQFSNVKTTIEIIDFDWPGMI